MSEVCISGETPIPGKLIGMYVCLRKHTYLENYRYVCMLGLTYILCFRGLVSIWQASPGSPPLSRYVCMYVCMSRVGMYVRGMYIWGNRHTWKMIGMYVCLRKHTYLENYRYVCMLGLTYILCFRGLVSIWQASPGSPPYQGMYVCMYVEGNIHT